jgi:hypothetical protein
MASVALTEVTAYNTLVGATNVTSADTAFSVSGILKDEDLNVVFVNGANSSLVVALQRGEYANGDSSLSGTDADTLTTIAQSTVRVISGIDGSKYRDTDGSVDMTLALTGSGNCNIYCFSKKLGV